MSVLIFATIKIYTIENTVKFSFHLGHILFVLLYRMCLTLKVLWSRPYEKSADVSKLFHYFKYNYVLLNQY
jgi:hypothetical protein